MISDELLERYHISKQHFELDLLGGYHTFLIATDYIPNKIIEAQILNTTLSRDYTEELQARQHAREQIRILELQNHIER